MDITAHRCHFWVIRSVLLLSACYRFNKREQKQDGGRMIMSVLLCMLHIYLPVCLFVFLSALFSLVSLQNK